MFPRLVLLRKGGPGAGPLINMLYIVLNIALASVVAAVTEQGWK